jgi:hypothetical protein
MKRTAGIATLGVAAWVLSGTVLAQYNNAPQTITVPRYSHTTIKVSNTSQPIKVSKQSHPIKVTKSPKHPKASRN